LIKAYEMAFELAWKCLKDYLQFGGFTEPSSPREVIKESFKQGYLEDGATWIKMLDERNELTHVYSENKSRAAAQLFVSLYLPRLQTLAEFLRSR
jgi:nucleotidyltransferase substrate binding protein (TIGR01987 family)